MKVWNSKREPREAICREKRESVFLGALISSFLGAFLFYLLNPIFFSGDEKLLGSHDTEIPFFSSWQFTNDLFNRNFTIYNLYDQTDYTFAHGTAGHFTIPSFITSIITITVREVFAIPMDGKLFLQLHSWVWVLSQLMLRNIGYLLLSRNLAISRKFMYISMIVFQPLITYTLTFHYLIGFLYSFIPLLVYLLWEFLEQRKADSFLYLIVILSISMGQGALFATTYMLQTPFVLLCFYILIFLIKQKKRNGIFKEVAKYLKSILKYKVSTNSLAKSLHNVLRTKKIFLVIIVILNLLWAFYSFISINRNYAILVERKLGMSFNLWRDLVLASGASDITQLLNVNLNATAGGWQFIGFAPIIFFIIGCTTALKERLSAMLIGTIFLIYCLQISPLIAKSTLFENLLGNSLQAPLKLFALAFKSIYMVLFPFASIYRSPTMLVWAIYLLSVPIIAVGISRFFAAKVFNIGLISIIWLVSNIYIEYAQDQSGKNLLFIAKQESSILLAFIVMYMVWRYFKQKSLIPFVCLCLLFVMTSSSFFQIRYNMKTPVLFGGRIEPRAFLLAGSNNFSNASIVEYSSPLRKIEQPVIVYSDAPWVLPKTGIFILDNESPNSNYFGPHTNVSKYWGSTFIGDYSKEYYYQSKNILFKNYAFDRSRENRILNFVAVSPFMGMRNVDIFDPFFKSDNTHVKNLKLEHVKIVERKVSVGGVKQRYLVVRDSRLQEIESSKLTSKMQITILYSESANAKFVNSVFGLPISKFSFSVNSFEPNSIYIALPDKYREFNYSNAAISIKYFTQEINDIHLGFRDGKIMTNLLMPSGIERRFVIWQIPFEESWKISKNGTKVKGQSCNGWLCIEIEKGSNEGKYSQMVLSYEPFGMVFSLSYFFQGGINLLGLIIALCIIVRSVGQAEENVFARTSNSMLKMETTDLLD